MQSVTRNVKRQDRRRHCVEASGQTATKQATQPRVPVKREMGGKDAKEGAKERKKRTEKQSKRATKNEVGEKELEEHRRTNIKRKQVALREKKK